MSANIGRLIQIAVEGWQPPLKDPKARVVMVYRNAAILSGAELVNSPNECEQLLRQFPDTIANVPEGNGECY